MMLSLVMPGPRVGRGTFAFLVLLVSSIVSQSSSNSKSSSADIIRIDGDSIVREDVSQVTRIFYAKLNAGLVVHPEDNTTEMSLPGSRGPRGPDKYVANPKKEDEKRNTGTAIITPVTNLTEPREIFENGLPVLGEQRAYAFAEKDSEVEAAMPTISEECENSTLSGELTDAKDVESTEEQDPEENNPLLEVSESAETIEWKDKRFLCSVQCDKEGEGENCTNECEDIPERAALQSRSPVSINTLKPPEDSQFYFSSSTLQDLWQNHINAAEDIPFEIVDVAPSELVEYYLPPPDHVFSIPAMTSSDSRASPPLSEHREGNLHLTFHTPTPVHVLPRPPLHDEAHGSSYYPTDVSPPHYSVPSRSLDHVMHPTNQLAAQARTPETPTSFLAGLGNIVGNVPPKYVVNSNMPTPLLINTLAGSLPELHGQPPLTNPGITVSPHGQMGESAPNGDLTSSDQTRVLIRLKPGQTPGVTQDDYSEVNLNNGQRIRIRIAEQDQPQQQVPTQAPPTRPTPQTQRPSIAQSPPVRIEVNRPIQSPPRNPTSLHRPRQKVPQRNHQNPNFQARPPQNRPGQNGVRQKRPGQFGVRPNRPNSVRQTRPGQHGIRPNHQNRRPHQGVLHAGVLPVQPIVNVGIPHNANDRLATLDKIKDEIKDLLDTGMAVAGGSSYQSTGSRGSYESADDGNAYQPTDSGISYHQFSGIGGNSYQSTGGGNMYQSNQGGSSKGDIFNNDFLGDLSNKFNPQKLENLANSFNKNLGGIANKFNKGMGDISNEISPIINNVKSKFNRLVNPFQTKVESSFDSSVGFLQMVFGNVLPSDYYEKVLTSLAILAFVAFAAVRFIVMYNAFSSSVTLGKVNPLLDYLRENQQLQPVYQLATSVYDAIDRWSDVDGEGPLGLPNSLSNLFSASSIKNYLFGSPETKEIEEPADSEFLRKTLYVPANTTQTPDDEDLGVESNANKSSTSTEGLFQEAENAARLGVALVDLTWQFGRPTHTSSESFCLQRPICELSSISDRQEGVSSLIFPIVSTGVSWMARPPDDIFSFLEILRPLWLANTDALGEGCQRIHSCDAAL